MTADELILEHADDVLCHHGRLHQKWGQRNGPPYPLNREGLAKFNKKLKMYNNKRKQKAAAAKAKAERRRSAKTYAKLSKKEEKRNPELAKIRQMTDQDLKRRTERLNLENNYYQALYRSKQNQPQTAGQKIAKVAGDVASTAFKNVATPAATYAGKQILKKTVGDETYKKIFDGSNNGGSKKKKKNSRNK